MKDENELLQQKLRAQKEPTISMSQLVRTQQKGADDSDDVFVGQPEGGLLHHDQTSEFVLYNLL